MEHWNLRTVDVEPRRPSILASTDEGRAVLLVLRAGEALQEHEVHERSWLFVAEGGVEIDLPGGERREVGAGEFLTFAPREPHAVRAAADARLLLLLTPWPGAGHPGAQTLADKAAAPERAAELAARSDSG
jgi:quercetin dioxygenase-like cupin family protein